MDLTQPEQMRRMESTTHSGSCTSSKWNVEGPDAAGAEEEDGVDGP
jgi:hypothetical protein